MEEQVLKILADFNDELLTYTGNNMLEDGLVNSLSFINLVSALEDEFDLEFDASLLEEQYFGNKDRIIQTLKEFLKDN